MHSVSSRFNYVIIFAALTMLACCFLNHLHGFVSSRFHGPVPITLKVHSVKHFFEGKKEQQASLQMEVKADLSGLYNWNLKQLFAYVEAQWTDPVTKLHSATILSDWILQSPYDRSLIQEEYSISTSETQLTQYQLRDVYKSLRGKQIKLYFRVEYMPVFGIFWKETLYETSFKMPTEYIR